MMHSWPVGEGKYLFASTTQAKQNPVEVQLAQFGTWQVVVGAGNVSLMHCAVGSITYPISHCEQIFPAGVTVQFKHIGRVQVEVVVLVMQDPFDNTYPDAELHTVQVLILRIKVQFKHPVRLQVVVAV